ncbi:MAG TPA: RelA/SpoT family protein [Candidatus Nanoarchaeia archaeon]|nr:RelA/SpoT family protein [Candidatus Nanoarchaeia archaeon]
MDFNRLIKKIKSYDKDADFDLIKKAYETSARLHSGQKRVSGQDYIVHPLSTAFILAELKLDDTCVCAGLLHDVLEDTSYSYDELKKEFGLEIAGIVDGVSKIKALKHRQEYTAESVKKLLLATAKDLRVILVKLADKLHNMRTINALPQEKRKRIAQEVLDVYSPIAYRLGLADIKWELEDLAFKELYPGLFEEFKTKIDKTKKQREQYINKLRRDIINILRKNKVKFFSIDGRAKNFYSIFKKMQKKQVSFEEIYDLIGLRIIVNCVKDCYEALGVIHGVWKPLPGKFKDYIARPKENLYQSLHTVVIADGLNVEFQIRTKEMDDIANAGVAAHFLYKGLGEDKKFDRKLNWIKQILDYRNVSGEEFMKSLLVDVFGDRIYVFTPKGDLIELPSGSCIVDFAYAVHSELGNKCVGGKVNDKFVSLKYVLHSGDKVEIVTSKQRVMPGRDWLKFVKSEKARIKIKQALHLLQGIPAGSMKNLEKDNSKGSLVQVNVPKAIISFGKCCNPLPGDGLLGLVSRSNRVMVHKEDCERINLKKESSKKRIKAEWREKIDSKITLKVVAYDRIGLFADISHTLAALKINVDTAKAYTYGKKDAACEFSMYFNDIKELSLVIERVKKIADVLEVQLLV